MAHPRGYAFAFVTHANGVFVLVLVVIYAYREGVWLTVLTTNKATQHSTAQHSTAQCGTVKCSAALVCVVIVSCFVSLLVSGFGSVRFRSSFNSRQKMRDQY